MHIIIIVSELLTRADPPHRGQKEIIMGNFDPFTTIDDMTVAVDMRTIWDANEADYYENIQARIDWLEAEIDSAPDWYWEKHYAEYREEIEALKELLP